MTGNGIVDGSGSVSPDVKTLARAAKDAARRLASVPTEARDRALAAIALRLGTEAGSILAANALDVKDAAALVARGELARPLLDRLRLDAAKLAGMAEGVRAVAALRDPSGRVLSRTLLDDGLVLEKISCPLGLLAVIFESRPDAVTQISALALKSGNAVILKGGREADRTTTAIVAAIGRALAEVSEIPAGCVVSVSTRAAMSDVLSLDGVVDLVIPRGSNELVRQIQAGTRIPVMGHADGICHVYLDASADAAKAVRIVLDAKLQYVSACNAAETLLVHGDAVRRVLRPVLEALLAKGVEVRACGETRSWLPDLPLAAASPEDWDTEHLAPVIGVKVVASLEEALEHVAAHGSGHTEAIVTEDAAEAERFLDAVDAAGVFHNASTRFADGFRYGLGAEVGIATGKLHARGPVGLEGLVTYKYKLRGTGQVVADYSGPAARPFLHRPAPRRDVRFSVLVRATPDRVWDALATAEGLDGWFTTGAEVDARPGGSIRLRWKDWNVGAYTGENGGAVLEARRPERFVFRWKVDSGRYETTVEIDLALARQGDATLVSLVEGEYEEGPVGDAERLARAAGWGQVLTLLKLFVEHGLKY